MGNFKSNYFIQNVYKIESYFWHNWIHMLKLNFYLYINF